MRMIVIFLLLLTCWSNYGIVSVSSNAAETVPTREHDILNSGLQDSKEASLIVQDMNKVPTVGNDVSVDCWVNVVNALSTSTVVPHHHHQQKQEQQQHAAHFSAGANFCSSMEEGKKRALTLGLTKCHLVTNGLRKLPDNCLGDSISLGEDERGIQACLSDLDHAQYHLYSDYFRDTGKMCRELMEDMQIHRKHELLNRYEEYARATHLENQNKDQMLRRYEENGTKLDEINKKSAEREDRSAERENRNIENWKQIEHVPNLINEIPNRVDNALDSMGERIVSKVSKWISNPIGKIFGQRGLQRFSSAIESFRGHGLFGWYALNLWARYILIFSCILIPSFASKRFRSSRRFIFYTSLLELVLEHALHHLGASGAIDRRECDYLIASLRSRDVLLYVAALMAAFIWSFVKEDVREDSIHAKYDLHLSSNVVTQMNNVLEEMKSKVKLEEERIRQEQDSLRKERELFQLQILQLHRQFHENYGLNQHHQPQGPRMSLSLPPPTPNTLAFVSPSPCKPPRVIERSGSMMASAFTNVQQMNDGAEITSEATNKKRKHKEDSRESVVYCRTDEVAATKKPKRSCR